MGSRAGKVNLELSPTSIVLKEERIKIFYNIEQTAPGRCLRGARNFSERLLTIVVAVHVHHMVSSVALLFDTADCAVKSDIYGYCM